jgi:hypothetical protein
MDETPSLAVNLTEEKPEISLIKEIPNPCQGYKADPVSKLHLCQTCAYHQYRNETKP